VTGSKQNSSDCTDFEGPLRAYICSRHGKNRLVGDALESELTNF